MAVIVHYFKDTDMRCAHDGLKYLAKQAKQNPEALKPGEFMLFVNSGQTIAKILGSGNAILHLKSESGRIDFRTLRYLPEMFAGKTFTYNDALKEVITKDFRRKKA